MTTTAPATRLVAVGRLEDVPRFEGRPVTVAGRRIAIFNTPSGVRALEDACPHKGGPLSDGLVGDGCVVCPLHNRRIDARRIERQRIGRSNMHRDLASDGRQFVIFAR